MARIQILHLPGPADSHDFALVVDQATDDDALDDDDFMGDLKARLGARSVIVTAGTLDVA